MRNDCGVGQYPRYLQNKKYGSLDDWEILYCCWVDAGAGRIEHDARARLESVFLRKVDELEFSVRTANCLKNDNIIYIGDLVLKSEEEMPRTPNFGRKSLNEIKVVLAEMGLQFDMEIPGWPSDKC